MKKLVFLLILLFAVPVFSQHVIPRAIKINGVTLGTSYRTVLRRFGKPTKIEIEDEDDGSGAKRRIVTYRGLSLEFLQDYEKKQYYVAVIELTSRKWRDRRIGVGASSSAVRKRFGEPWELESGAEADKVWQYLIREGEEGSRGRILFTIRSRRVVSIEMFYSCG